MVNGFSAASGRQPFSPAAIVSLVLAFFLPVVGAVVGVIALLTLRGRRGRGLAVAAIVIGVVLSLLIGLSAAFWLGATESEIYGT
jgi:ABC-type sugar transport system permease subunit